MTTDMSDSPILVWLRNDLRLGDNPALAEAAATGRPVVPIFVERKGAAAGAREAGAASKWWLHHSLADLEKNLAAQGSRLSLLRGEALTCLRTAIRETGATSVFWNRRYTPLAIAADSEVKTSLVAEGIEVKSFQASLLWEPWRVTNKQGKPYRVFTPFWNAVRRDHPLDEPLAKPRKLREPTRWPASSGLDVYQLLPRIPWTDGMAAQWTMGEKAAWDRLTQFRDQSIQAYPEQRNVPANAGTSALSPHLAFGEISPRQAWTLLHKIWATEEGSRSAAAEAWLRQLAWREFSHHLLYNFPHTANAPLRDEYAELFKQPKPEQLEAWQRGRTGFPIVDAGMRELWTTGWMHNRVRMIVASFLTKDLLAPWQSGEAWFWDTLVDADQANNVMGWQWTAGCGADASPFFRIFNPISQGEKFDPDGSYVRRWVPELSRLSAKSIHQPWSASDAELAAAGVELGQNYPEPLLDHGEARLRALQAYKAAVKG